MSIYQRKGFSAAQASGVIGPWWDVGLQYPRFQPVVEQDVESKQLVDAVAATHVRLDRRAYVRLRAT